MILVHGHTSIIAVVVVIVVAGMCTSFMDNLLTSKVLVSS
jgi:hypothetical protein